MSVLKKMFLNHPATVGESYSEHFIQAMRFSTKMFAAAGACFVHGFIPCLFERTGSKAIADLNERMVLKRHEQTPKLREKRQAA